jgi:hypothetical protein
VSIGDLACAAGWPPADRRAPGAPTCGIIAGPPRATDKGIDVKKLWLGLLAAAACGGLAAAEWTPLGGNEETTVYADVTTLGSTTEKTTTMWTLVGSKTARQVGATSFSSIKTQFEFDCAGRRIRELQSTFYAGAKGDGAEVGRHAEAGAWEPWVEGTLKEGLSRVACEKT